MPLSNVLTKVISYSWFSIAKTVYQEFMRKVYLMFEES